MVALPLACALVAFKPEGRKTMKHCQFEVISVVTTAARTKFRSSSSTFYSRA